MVARGWRCCGSCAGTCSAWAIPWWCWTQRPRNFQDHRSPALRNCWAPALARCRGIERRERRRLLAVLPAARGLAWPAGQAELTAGALQRLQPLLRAYAAVVLYAPPEQQHRCCTAPACPRS